VSASISVVIPVRDCETYVAQAIQSVLAQTRPPDQVIVIDDGSTDRTLEMVQPFASRVTIRRQPALGQSAAVNNGVLVSTGDLIAFVDADDLWLPRKLELQAAVLDGDLTIDAVYGMVEQFDEALGGSETVPGYSRITLLIRRAAMGAVGPADETLIYGEFVDWYARSVHAGIRSVLVPEVVTRRRVHAANLSRTYRSDQLLRVVRDSLQRRRSTGAG
jgi:glycosyltransferase involved in cell wall biosynthesis